MTTMQLDERMRDAIPSLRQERFELQVTPCSDFAAVEDNFGGILAVCVWP